MQVIPPGRVGLSVILILCVFSVQPLTAVAQRCDQPIGKMASVQGTVESKRAGDTHWQTVRLNDTLCPGDTVRVADNSRAELALANQSVLRINENTTITLEGVEEERTTVVDLLKGAALFFSRGTRDLKVKTLYSIFGVRGTEFYVAVEERRAFMSVFEGTVLAENPSGSLLLRDGQSTVAEAGKAPVLTAVARPRDAVAWSLYYPPVLYDVPADLIAQPPESIGDPDLLAQRAALLLNVGRVEAASADLARALAIDAGNSDALALQAIVAVVQNDVETALEKAQKAVAADPQSATALIALSYAQQARFDLEGARGSLENAVKLAPDNALAWARLSEIQASFGRLDKALAAARKAESLAPELSLAQSVLGFALLTQVKIDAAKEAFTKAIARDQAAPLPRLGLGLAMIRKGDLKQGGRQIEIAAGLDPGNSLIRSYLGKTYYEEKRTGLDAREYAVAKELDPNDPTPWFYDAIRLQTVNRPVEALHNYQKAIELNDNRAVYRSKLLLDSDLAARQSSLARIYNDLGFGQLGLAKGYNAVNTDPSNFSAHRFLADTYSNLPRHEIARVSELLQSQLLQPININPIQPQLAATNLGILDGAGPKDLSFNEFNPLFYRNRLALQANGVAGGNDTLGNDLVLSGVYDKASFSFGQFHFESDGFRENNDQNRNLYNLFAQVNPWHSTSFLAEYRASDSQFGDLPLRFDPELFFAEDRNEEEADSIRLGFRHAFSPRSDIIATAIYKDAEASLENEPAEFQFDIEEEGYMVEAQHLLRLHQVSLISGVGTFNSELTENFTIFQVPLQPNEEDIRHTNLYLYSQIPLPSNFLWTLGFSADFFDGIVEKNLFNPKLGLSWKIFPFITLRGAVFRTLGRSFIADQTIEPTQVAGFNQFFDAIEGEEAWRYGGAIDIKFSENLFGGFTLSKRELEVPFRGPTQIVDEADWKEIFSRAYLYWTPLNWLSLSAEYELEKYDRELKFTGPELIYSLETHRLPLGVNFFFPFGLISRFKFTYVNQEGEFDPFPLSFMPVEGRDSFWSVDASIGYRLPKRFGLISVEARNLFDKEFQFQNMDSAGPRIAPERLILGKISLSF
jgi:Tfp pilus assembly protein PilF